ncbi:MULTISPECIES: AraC family transcriptional regulator [unclassified Paenibacillus]|uniref:AraC family transcriptional regulator n=1 Tax=unclassified Paenibacillus TaxID=185978 RepID=UPI002404A80A|nr:MULTISPECIES: AraC family transcriptional regulator [unclassified Paenibacillus]MDF9841793.1 AraC family transcriptional regulator [Paenibacillus sp. PastF-2]MDF9848526.1 AraC family transcriptional regulator [Paenibacillus sp. PastM-2]MDF9854953.1 AraC family transcriptional regulator [Paenibacillus sp. PastF-1]MDH6480222.1 AraC family transcriptional regulator [Paenibacillus sp. PastH-2]
MNSKGDDSVLEWLIRMKEAMDYMESKMTEPLRIEDVAGIAHVSPFHFQRMFSMLTGFTVADYIRKRRLTLAAQELASSKIRVLDVALKYGYDSPESFAKAFRKAHGLTPSAAREPGVQLKAFPRLSFHLSLKGDQEMEYKIVDKPAFNVIGKSIQVTCKDGENFRRIPEFWNECNEDGTSDELIGLASEEAWLGICMSMDMEKDLLSYWVGVQADEATDPHGYEKGAVPAASWAVFTSKGPLPHTLQTVWQRIYQEWFPGTGYQHAGGPEIELYPPGDTSAEDYVCEVWIPVVKK